MKIALAIEDVTSKTSKTLEVAETAVKTTSSIQPAASATSTVQETSSRENSEMKPLAIDQPSNTQSQSQFQGVGAEQFLAEMMPSQMASPDTNSCVSGTRMEVSRGPACESATTASDQEV